MAPRKRTNDVLSKFEQFLIDNKAHNRSLLANLAATAVKTFRRQHPEDSDRLHYLRAVHSVLPEVVKKMPLFDDISETQRGVYLLYEGSRATYEEIATIADIKKGTVRSRLSRARRALEAAERAQAA